jgi:hypothetical protein
LFDAGADLNTISDDGSSLHIICIGLNIIALIIIIARIMNDKDGALSFPTINVLPKCGRVVF